MNADLALVLMVIGTTLVLLCIAVDMLVSIFGEIRDARDKIIEEIRKHDVDHLEGK